jgi:hypothetical protein
MGIDCVGYGATTMASDSSQCDCTKFRTNKIFWDRSEDTCMIDCSQYNAKIIYSDPTTCELTKNGNTYIIAWDSKINNNMGIDCIRYGG